jgi:hypothetical protein
MQQGTHLENSPRLLRIVAPAHNITLKSCVLLVTLLVAMMAAVEAGARVLVDRISRIEGRVAREYKAAVAPTPPDRPVILFVGNSLLDAAVQFDRVKEALAPRLEARRVVVEQTAYHDWHYGIRRLFADGSRPSVIVLMLNGDQIVTNGSRGEYSAYRLVTHGDILNFSRDLDLHPTNATSMIFANFSAFYALRSDIRKVILGRLMPDAPLFMGRLAIVPAAPIPVDRLRSVIRQRLALLKNECARHGTRLVFAIPPRVVFSTLPVIRDAAKEAGVLPLLPFTDGDFTASDFYDNFHLNDAGAAKYTTRLISELPRSADAWKVR